MTGWAQGLKELFVDFLKILKSFEDFVYEALIWLVLLPKTLWRILRRPRQMVT